jgi:hypothetical protein
VGSGDEIYDEGPDAVGRLAELGLTLEDLIQALEGADQEAAHYQSDEDAKNALTHPTYLRDLLAGVLGWI